MRFSSSDFREKAASFKNTWSKLQAEQKISLFVMLFLLVSLPVGILLTLTPLNPFLRAGFPTTPPVTSPVNTPTPFLTNVIIQESFDGNGPVNPANWGWSGSLGSSVLLANNQLKISVAQGHDAVGGNDAVAFPYINYQIPNVSDFDATVDLIGIDTILQSGWEEFKYGSSTLSVRRSKYGTQEKIEAWTGTSVLNNLLASVDLPPSTASVKVRIKRVGLTVKGYYDLGNGFITLTSVNADPYQSYTFPRLVVENGVPDYPAVSGFFDNYYAQGLVSGVTPTPSVITPYPTIAVYRNIVNSASGKSCTQLCKDNGLSCVSVGTNEFGTNGFSWQSYRNECAEIPIACDGTMKKTAKRDCSGNQQPWTNCRCQLVK